MMLTILIMIIKIDDDDDDDKMFFSFDKMFISNVSKHPQAGF